MIEREIKLELADLAAYEAVCERFRELCGGRSRVIHQLSHYLDSGDRLLVRSLAILRLRAADGHVLTYKNGELVGAGSYRSHELEQPLSDEQARTVLRDPSAVYRLRIPPVLQLEEDFGVVDLELLGRLANERWKFDCGEFEVELDRMRFDGGHEEYEIEIESDRPDAARRWCEENLRGLGVELRPASLTKLERLLRRR